MFSLFNIMFPLIFILVIGLFIITIVRGLMEWGSNNKQPILNSDVKVVSKRSKTSRSSNHHNNHMHSSTSTTYYLTFEFQNGERREFKVSGKEYGLIAEGDVGNLIFQGTRYHGFDREHRI